MTPRIAVLGLGAFGLLHVRGLVRAGVAPVAVADLDHDRVLAGLKVGPGAAGFEDPIALLEQVPLDGVVVATPAATHVDLAVAAAARGIRVLLEKPIAVDAAGLDRLAASAGSELITPGHVLRYEAAHRELRDGVAGGRLGELRGVSASRDRERGHLRYGEPDPVLLTQVHDLDLAYWLTGAAPTEIGAAGGRELIFSQGTAGGVVWSLRASYLLPEGAPARDRLEVYGSAGTSRLAVSGRGTTLTWPDGEQRHWPPSDAPGLDAELAGWLGLVRDGGPVVITLEEGIAVVRTALAARASAGAGGTPVSVAERR
ncbi:Gfo/Idh/MocA family protein [Microlunatus sp. GCM10028923]|uniref:Gfo/Idh/MocA family protein n=1 Tax=Microlunatus sp. GCM10028923 TaxID=3273400 RepID=UPI00360E4D5D